MIHNLWLLMKNKRSIYIATAVLYLIVVPAIVLLGSFFELPWYDEELLYGNLYQVLFVFFSGLSFIFLLYELVEEKGREIFYIRKKLFLGEVLGFLLLDELVLGISLMICSNAADIYGEGVIFISVQNILVLGILYFILYLSSSATVAVGVLVCLLIAGEMNISPYLSVMVLYTGNYSEMLVRTVYLLGVSIIFWSLGTFANEFYYRYE